MKIKRVTKVTITKNKIYYKKYCIYYCYTSYGSETISYNSPVASYTKYQKALKELKKLTASGGRHVLLQYLDYASGKPIIQNEGRLPQKEFAVFSTNFKGEKNKAYYFWGTIKGVDRHHAMSKIESSGFHDSKYRCVFLHVLKDGKISKNPFPHTPILEINDDAKEKGVSLSNVKHVPLNKIIKNGKGINLS